MAPLLSLVHNTDTVSVRTPVREDTPVRPPAAGVPEPDPQPVVSVGAARSADVVPRPAGSPEPAVAVRQKPVRPAWRWAAPPLLAAAAYVCWVLARQALWGIQEKEPWTLLSVSALVYLVAIAWTMVLVAVTVWSGHRSGRLFWPWALLACGPGFAYLCHFATVNKTWGGSVGADFYEMIILLAALSLLALVAAFAIAARLAPPLRALGRRLRPSAERSPSAADPQAADVPRGPSPDVTA
jgi:hypothetical protein